MMTEKKFSTVYSSFWQDLLPGSERYIRHINLTSERYIPPLASFVSIEERGVVNEMGFRLLCQLIADGQDSWRSLHEEAIKQIASDTVNFIRRFRASEPESIGVPSDSAIEEAGQIAERLHLFIKLQTGWSQCVVKPRFAGCGKIEACEGDMLLFNTLYEVKAGDRTFRVADIRQVLTYCALNYAKHMNKIDRIVLVNPRRGLFWGESLYIICQEMAGMTPENILSDIVDFAAEPVNSI